MPELDLGTDLLDGQTATANLWNDKFDAILDLLNVTKLDDENIQAGAIIAALIGDGAVTAAKVATDAITNAKVSASAAIAGSKLDTGDGRLVQATGLAAASGDLSLGTSYADITGATVTFTPDVACYALVTAIFDFAITATGNIYTADLFGTLVVDGTAQTAEARLTDTDDSSAGARATVSQVYRVALTAGDSHTLKLQGKRASTIIGSAALKATNTQFIYQLVAQ